jgi:hypothetical protein
MLVTKKRLIIGIGLIITVYIFALVSRSFGYNNYIKDNKIVLDKDKVQQIIIAPAQNESPWVSNPWLTVDATDKELLSGIVDYLTSLHIDNVNKFYTNFHIRAYEVGIRLKDNTEGYFIVESKEFPQKIENIFENYQSKTAKRSIEGSVISLDEEKNSGNKFCRILDKNALEHKILITNTKIVNSEGWEELRIADEVKALIKPAYSKSAETEASAIFVHNQEGEK